MRTKPKYRAVADEDYLGEYWGYFVRVEKVGGPKRKPGQPLIMVFCGPEDDPKKVKRTARDLANMLNRDLRSKSRFRKARKSVKTRCCPCIGVGQAGCGCRCHEV